MRDVGRKSERALGQVLAIVGRVSSVGKAEFEKVGCGKGCALIFIGVKSRYMIVGQSTWHGISVFGGGPWIPLNEYWSA